LAQPLLVHSAVQPLVVQPRQQQRKQQDTWTQHMVLHSKVKGGSEG
jgi:hypothetical protein